MRILLSVLFTALLTATASSQTWYARGEFNGWSEDNPLSVDPLDPTHYTTTISGLFDNVPYMWKIAEADWEPNHPASDARVYTDALGEITFHLYDQESWSDGWFPNNTRRVGYDDHNQFDWELVGSFNGWPDQMRDPTYFLTDLGNGLHSGTFAFDAGIQDFKFRGQVPDDPLVEGNQIWDTSIGNHFGNDAGNNSFLVQNDGDQWTFELDLPNGRFRWFEANPTVQPGDYDGDGGVTAADYVVWRKTDSGNAAGYEEWRENFGEGAASLTWIARATLAGDTWQETLVDQGNGLYSVTRTGLTPGQDYEFQVIRSDLSVTVPGSPVKVRADDQGEINLNFYELTSQEWADGWQPNIEHRIGYEDHDQFDWQIVGSFQDPEWPAANDPNFFLTDQGNGVHSGTFMFAEPGEYFFKFRQQDDTNPWNTSIGDNFGNGAGNGSFTVTDPNEQWTFVLDLPGGKWQAFEVVSGGGGAVPEPGSFVLVLGLALVACGAVRRR